jgi:hypothetical protein
MLSLSQLCGFDMDTAVFGDRPQRLIGHSLGDFRLDLDRDFHVAPNLLTEGLLKFWRWHSRIPTAASS